MPFSSGKALFQWRFFISLTFWIYYSTLCGVCQELFSDSWFFFVGLGFFISLNLTSIL